ncbi:MAG: hypothetical protein JXA42_08990 [Anaerolineales bacterium]|nr:hypothetical protein [Anaerolineales bacterium]
MNTEIQSQPWKRLKKIICLFPILLFITVILGSCFLIPGLNQQSSNPSSSQVAGSKPSASATLKGDEGLYHHVDEGDNVVRYLGGKINGDNPPATVAFVYTPPKGATNVTFTGQQPSHQREDGSYVFYQVPVNQDGKTQEIKVDYNAPSLTDVENNREIIDTLQVGLPDGSSTTNNFSATVDPAHRKVENKELAPTRKSTPASTNEDYLLWETHLFQSQLEDLDTDLCERYVENWTDENNFYAIRFPLLDPAATYTEGVRLPIAMRDGYFPYVSINDYSGGTTVVSATLELLPEYNEALANVLGGDEESTWAALSSSYTTSLVCPSSLNVSAENWDTDIAMWIDYGGGEEDGREEVLELYYCHKGQDFPEYAPEDWAVSSVQSSNDNQGWNITCLGPQPLRLQDLSNPEPPFKLSNTATSIISPTDRITVGHRINNLPFAGETIEISLTLNSKLDIPWGIYSGTVDGPELPLTIMNEPFELQSASFPPFHQRYFWLIADIPEGKQGAETVIITATRTTQPDQTTWTSDLFWVGEWTPPDTIDEIEYSSFIYLPLILRN